MKLNIIKSYSDLPLLKFLLLKNDWKETINLNNSDVVWTRLSVRAEDLFIAQENRLNRIPGLEELAYKKATL